MGLLNPLFLLGAAAAAVPILLHLVRRAHARKREFPSLIFLRRINRRTIRYQKLRHLLLLLLRVLALLLIVLAFTRPYFESAQAPAVVGRVTSAHIILLDNSMSMGYRDRWERAKSAAAEIVRDSGPGDRYAVLEFSDRTVALTQLTSSSSEAMDRIENDVKLTDQPTRYGQALRSAEKFAMDAGTGKRIIHLISDFQKSGWASEEQDFRLGAGMELRLVDVGSDDYSNLAIRDVRVVEAEQGSDTIIKVSPVNFGAADRKDVRLSLSMDGRTISEKSIDLPEGASPGVEFRVPGLTAGTHSVVVEIEDPELTRDNRFYMTLETRGKTPVLAVEDPRAGESRSPSFFLSNALNIDSFSPYELKVVSPQNFSISGEIIIWNNAPGGDRRLQKDLREFVESGGGLAIILDDSSRYDDFNRSFGSWLPVKAEQGKKRFRSADEYVLMTDVHMDHPIFRPFSKPHSGNFSGARFFRHAKLTLGAGAEAPARFENGDPALVSVDVGKGRVLIFASSADDESNDLPLKAVYAPLWQQMLRYLENFRERRGWVEVGDVVSPRQLLTDAALRRAKGDRYSDEAVVVLDPGRKRMDVDPGSDAVEMDTAGFYEFRTMNLSSTVAVNPKPRESDLAHGDADEMAAGWMSRGPAKPVRDRRTAPEEQDRRQRIWLLLLSAAVLFLLSESVISNYELRMTNGELKN